MSTKSRGRAAGQGPLSTKSRGGPAGQGPLSTKSRGKAAGQGPLSRKSRGGAGPCPQNRGGPGPLVHKIPRGGVGPGPLVHKIPRDFVDKGPPRRGILWTKAFGTAAGFGQQGPFHWKNSNFVRRLSLLNLRLTERCEIEFCRLSRQIRNLNSSEKSQRTALFRAKQGGPLRFF